MISLFEPITQVLDELAVFELLHCINEEQKSIKLMLSYLSEIPPQERTREILKAVKLLEKGSVNGLVRLLESQLN